MDLSEYRTQYKGEELIEPLPEAPWDLLKVWIERALLDKKIFEPTAMSLATCDKKGNPSLRIVLFKEVRDGGMVFYTNYNSRKAEEIKENPKVAATIWWPEIFRQIRIEGITEKVSEEESNECFQSRPRGSQISAVASNQSNIIESKEQLIQHLDAIEKEYEGKEVDRPDDWGGYFISIHSIEFWQGQPDRLHDRIRYRKDGNRWLRERLSP